MSVRNDVYKFKGAAVNLLGYPVKVGDKAPDFKLRTSIAPGSELTTLSTFAGKNLLISVAPSLDTGICATQTRTFNEKAAAVSNATVLTVTMDLPPAQARFCTTEGIKNLTTASDYGDRSFGMNYGFFVEEMQLLARGVVVVDKNGVVQYVEITKDILEEPNYDAALAVLNKLG